MIAVGGVVIVGKCGEWRWGWLVLVRLVAVDVELQI